jgi:hypothetical protein
MKKLIIITIALLFLANPTTSFAESIESFDVSIQLNKDGTFNIVEKILYDFGSNERHGIFRFIPRSNKLDDRLYRNHVYTVQAVKRNDSGEQYSKSFDDDNLSIKIGDPDKTIEGLHQYEIDYKVANGIGNFDDHDEIYWNVTGNGWNVPIHKATATLTLPENISVTKSQCFTGTSGSTEQNCQISPDQKSYSTQNLTEYEGLTLVAAFPANSFPKSTLTDRPATSLSRGAEIMLIILYGMTFLVLNAVIPFFLYRWYKNKKKDVRFGPPHVNFDIPFDAKNNRISPALAGTIDTAELEKDDVIATIFDLAIRKHLKISQTTEKQNFLVFNTDKTKYFFEKLSGQAQDSLEPHEEILMDRLFQDGNSVELETLNKDFYKTFADMEKKVYKQLENQGYYSNNPKSGKTMFIIIGIFSLIFGGIVLSILAFYLSKKRTNRTLIGDESDWRIDGLKLFLEKMERNYTWQANQLAIVEQMIPYAMALGYIDKFMEQLKIIMPEYNPTWYSGSTPFYNISPALMSSMNSSFTTTAPSSSSGFSGGSSGGGGGGGGGGSW